MATTTGDAGNDAVLLAEVRRFAAAWFPVGCAAAPPALWFGARKRKNRAAVNALVTDFGPTLEHLLVRWGSQDGDMGVRGCGHGPPLPPPDAQHGTRDVNCNASGESAPSTATSTTSTTSSLDAASGRGVEAFDDSVHTTGAIACASSTEPTSIAARAHAADSASTALLTAKVCGGGGGGGGVTSWSARDRLLAAVLADQMSRNWAAVGGVPPECAPAVADRVALVIASGVANECFGGGNGGALDGPPTEVGGGCDGDVDGDGGGHQAIGVDDGGDAHSDTVTSGVAVRELCSPDELCFFTLVFRHSSDPVVVARSVELLEAALRGGVAGVCVPLHGPERDLCERFLAESRAKHSALLSEAYIAETLANGAPTVLFDATPRCATGGGGWAHGGGLDGLDEGVLDAVCREYDDGEGGGGGGGGTCFGGVAGENGGGGGGTFGGTRRFLPVFSDGHAASADAAASLARHPMCVALQRALVRDGVGVGDVLLLSLSGGVDSTAHAVALALLRPRLGFRLGALHMHHANRGCAAEEERWVTWLARTLGISLFAHTVRLERPHGDTRTGLSRDRYEEATKLIRFHMYRACLDAMCRDESVGCAVDASGRVLGDDDSGGRGRGRGRDGMGSGRTHGSAGVCYTDACAAGTTVKRWVVLGHHADDVDENRLTELGKSNVIDVNGMRVLIRMLGTTVYRPLLSERKSMMYSMATAARIPFMADSTPRWSRRGWTRHVLDALADADRDKLQRSLALVGDASAELGCKLDAALATHSSARVMVLDGWPPPGASHFDAAPADSDRGGDCNGHVNGSGDGDAVALVRLMDLDTVVMDVGPVLKRVWELAATIADVWNPAIAVHNTNTSTTDDARGIAGAADADVNEPLPCPLLPIRLRERQLDPHVFLFVHGIKRLLVRPDMLPFLAAGQVKMQSLEHVLTMARDAANSTAPVWSLLNARCPCVWIPTAGVLALYPARWMASVSRSALLKRSLVAACTASCERDTTAARECMEAD